MKQILLLIIGLVFAGLNATEVKAQSYSVSVQKRFSTGAVVTGSWTVLVSNLTRSVKAVCAKNGGVYSLALGTVISSSGAGNEAQQLMIPASMSDSVCYPMNISSGQRISIKALVGDVGSGDGIFSFIYN